MSAAAKASSASEASRLAAPAASTQAKVTSIREMSFPRDFACIVASAVVFKRANSPSSQVCLLSRLYITPACRPPATSFGGCLVITDRGSGSVSGKRLIRHTFTNHGILGVFCQLANVLFQDISLGQTEDLQSLSVRPSMKTRVSASREAARIVWGVASQKILRCGKRLGASAHNPTDFDRRSSAVGIRASSSITNTVA